MQKRVSAAPPLHILSPDADRYLLMDYLPGATLHDLVRPLQTISLQTRTEIARRFAEGLNVMHVQENVIHRDLKPANTLLTHAGRSIFLDFDRAVDMEKHGMSHDRFVGTLRYASPEQFYGIFRESDVFSLGMTLHSALFHPKREIYDMLKESMDQMSAAALVLLPRERIQGIINEALDRDIQDTGWNDLMKRVISVDRHKRISAAELEQTLHGMPRPDERSYAEELENLFR